MVLIQRLAGFGSISTKFQVSTTSPLSVRNSPSKQTAPIGSNGLLPDSRAAAIASLFDDIIGAGRNEGGTLRPGFIRKSPPHSITLSARARMASGIVRPMAAAALRFTA